jgi:hypothetical protein
LHPYFRRFHEVRLAQAPLDRADVSDALLLWSLGGTC